MHVQGTAGSKGTHVTKIVVNRVRKSKRREEASARKLSTGVLPPSRTDSTVSCLLEGDTRNLPSSKRGPMAPPARQSKGAQSTDQWKAFHDASISQKEDDASTPQKEAPKSKRKSINKQWESPAASSRDNNTRTKTTSALSRPAPSPLSPVSPEVASLPLNTMSSVTIDRVPIRRRNSQKALKIKLDRTRSVNERKVVTKEMQGMEWQQTTQVF